MNWHKIHTKRIGVVNRILDKDIKLQQQDEQYTCGVATIQNICKILHREMPSEDTLEELLGTTKDMGTAPEAVERVIAKMGLPVVHFQGDESLDRELSKNRIILAEFQDYQDLNHPEDVAMAQSSHFALIVGFDDAFYYCVDSYLPLAMNTSSCLKKIPKEKFAKEWFARSFDGSHVKKHWGLIIQI